MHKRIHSQTSIYVNHCVSSVTRSVVVPPCGWSCELLHGLCHSNYITVLLLMSHTSWLTWHRVGRKWGHGMHQLMRTGSSRTEMCLAPSRWPRTVAGIRAHLPCNRLPSSAGTYSGSSGEEPRAWRYCNRKGVWTDDDYSRCQFQKDVTRFLYVINQVCIWFLPFNTSHWLLPQCFNSNSHIKSLLLWPNLGETQTDSLFLYLSNRCLWMRPAWWPGLSACCPAPTTLPTSQTRWTSSLWLRWLKRLASLSRGLM